MRTLILTVAFAAGLCGAGPAKKADDSYSVLKAAKRFAVGPVSESAVITREEKALRALMKEPKASAKLQSLLATATPAGRMYALLGLQELKDPAFERNFPKYADRKDLVETMEGCIVSPRPIKDVVAEIRSGGYR